MASPTLDGETELSDENKEPGAAPYGNFINYYTFNPPENRLNLIPSSLLHDLGYDGRETLLMLDVGCNSGDLSVALYKHLLTSGYEGALHLLGFDRDEALVLRAQTSNPDARHISFIPLDITQEQASRSQLKEYLDQFGHPRFHLCVCLAVTMWVHLNHGDSGLTDLLSLLASMSDHLLLEAQPWKCYRSAARRLRKLGRSGFDHFKTLEIQGNMTEHIRRYLEEKCGMELWQSFGSTAWDRQLLLFKKDK
ncbi:pre-miRNA 5'-monophosphate methyltransferase [Denticeps clupeoides]|uniref:RNA methyltransferase n=1 Tax=Denticeps clupeoides TaxID=299321 RepID=A0AAY4A8H3_9TELE|nr:RNA 5'-monophosphate methyltransferase [Denticeps clupeoides]